MQIRTSSTLFNTTSHRSDKFHIKLRRSTIVKDMIEQFEKVTTEQLLCPIRVKCEGEETIDSRRISTNLYNEVTNNVQSLQTASSKAWMNDISETFIIVIILMRMSNTCLIE